ncbi:MAG: 30S ribosomal protein S7 [Candidatus Pacebacteria bacterium]|nr:30S ribosomal protein S7 [Candidatus Paceibacterota bacterium]
MDLIVNQKKYAPDLKYNSVLVSKMINMVMESGKKNIALKNVYKMMEILNEKTKQESLLVFETALSNIAPRVEIKGMRIGGANYQVPVPVIGERRTTLAMRWLLDIARKKKGKPISEKIADEILLAFKNEGGAIKKKIDVQKMAEANKAFAHFGRRM